MDSSLSADEVEKLVAYCQANLDLTKRVHTEEYGYVNLPLCVIHYVFSMDARYEEVRKIIRRFCNYTTVNTWCSGAAARYCIADLVQLYRETSLDFMVNQVYRNNGRTLTSGGMLKAEAILRIANSLLTWNVNTLADLPKVAGTYAFEDAFLQIPGLYSRVSLRRFYMLAGSVDHIKPDQMILRFIQSAIGRLPHIDEAHRLLLESCRILAVTYPELNPLTLDRQIWLFQRTQ